MSAMGLCIAREIASTHSSTHAGSETSGTPPAATMRTEVRAVNLAGRAEYIC